MKSSIQSFFSRLPVRSTGILLRLAAVAAGFLLSNAAVAGVVRPFGVAFAAAAPAEYTLWAAVGAAAGGLVFADTLHALLYAGAAALVVLACLGADKLSGTVARILFRPLAAALACLLCALLIEALTGFSLAGVLLAVSQAVLAGAGAFLGQRTFEVFAHGRRTVRLSTRDAVSVLLCIGVFLLALQPLHPFGFPPAAAAAGFVVLLWSYCAGETGGCLAGICCSVAAGLSEDGAYTLLSSALGGLLAGISAPAGRPAAVAGYTAACLLTMLVNGVAGTPALYALAALLAGLAFLLLPKRLLQRLQTAISPFTPANIAAETRRLLGRRLQDTSTAVGVVADSVTAVCNLFARLSEPSLRDITEEVRRCCCADCHRRAFCWERGIGGVHPAFSDALEVLQRDGRLTLQTLPDKLTIMCRTPEALPDAFNAAFAAYTMRAAQASAVRSANTMAAEQLRVAAALLADAAQDSEPAAEADLSAAATARDIFIKFALSPVSVSAAQTTAGHFFLRAVFAERPGKTVREDACAAFAARIGLPLTAPELRETPDGGYLLCCHEMPPFAVRTAYSQHSGNGETVCGDAYVGFSDEYGRFVLVLSDGMGTGERAALDSVMASSLLTTLLKAGISPLCAIRVVNTALLLRSADESMATLDVAIVDLYTGNTTLYKAGASFSVLQKGTKTAIIEQSSMPLGILNETNIAVSRFTMAADDILLLLSDGASPLAPAYFKALFHEKKNEPLKLAVSAITRAAAETEPYGRTDDITAAAFALVHAG